MTPENPSDNRNNPLRVTDSSGMGSKGKFSSGADSSKFKFPSSYNDKLTTRRNTINPERPRAL
jgi:hypothetical protein